jgi:hypothetical protein
VVISFIVECIWAGHYSKSIILVFWQQTEPSHSLSNLEISTLIEEKKRKTKLLTTAIKINWTKNQNI